MPKKLEDRHPVVRFTWSLRGFVTVCAAVTAFWGAAAALGMQVPRWVWHQEFSQAMTKLAATDAVLRKAISQARRERLDTRIEILRGQLFTATTRQQDLAASGRRVPADLRRRILDLTSKIEDLKSRRNQIPHRFP